MAEQTHSFVWAYLSSAGETWDSIFMVRYLGGAWGDPGLPFAAGTNEWYLMAEDTGAASGSFYSANVPKGKYKLQTYTVATTTYADIAPYTDFSIASIDLENHINDADADMRHDHDAIAIAAADQGRLGTTLDAALDNITGATWDKDTDDNLKEHLDDTTAAHAATAISHTIGALTEVGAILDDHESRLDTLESTDTADTPAGIGDRSGEIGIDIFWDAQDYDGIEYFFRYLWKHSYETVPAAYTDLDHQGRVLMPFMNVNYGTRRFDVAINTNDDLVLYYAVGAKAAGDASITWSAVQSTGVVIPKYRQEQILTLENITFQQAAKTADHEHIDSDEAWPTCTGETGGSPDDNFIIWSPPFDDVSVVGISVYSGDAMSGDATVKYITTTDGTNGSFTVSSATRRGTASPIAVPVDTGDTLKLWSLDPKGMGHFNIQIKISV